MPVTVYGESGGRDLQVPTTCVNNLYTPFCRAEAVATAGLHRLGRPEAVAALALFLCSERARHIQGTAIAVDGGATPGLY